MKELPVISILIFVCVTALKASDLRSSCDVTAQTEYGTVCGKTRLASNGDNYASFRGIRYAKAPLAKLRFAPPQKPDPYNGVFDASEHGPVCPQIDVFYGPIMQPRLSGEDCLRINVNVPVSSLPEQGAAKPLMPVLVFIHGGGFSYGSGDADLHGPEYLMAKKDVVLVTFNYRIGPIGFMSLYSKEVPGNAGLHDAIFAMKWVQNNIKNFGGDPSAVTIGGQSAGAAMAHLLSISPAVKGQNLFQGLIILSGSGIAGFFSPNKAYATLIRYLYLVEAGINVLQNQAGIHKDLCDAPIDKLVNANKVLLDILGLVTFAPVIEDEGSTTTSIIPKNPELLLREGYGNETVTWLEFCNNESGALKKRLEEINLETKGRLLPPLTIPFNIFYGSNLLTVPILTGMMSNEYFNNTLIMLEKWLPAITDGFYKYTSRRVAEKRYATNAKATYISEFSYKGTNDPFKVAQGRTWRGAGHGEDLPYFFRTNSMLGPVKPNELSEGTDDSKMKNIMTDYVSTFVKTGSPVPSSESSQWSTAGAELKFQSMMAPQDINFELPTPYMEDKKIFFDRMNRIGRGID